MSTPRSSELHLHKPSSQESNLPNASPGGAHDQGPGSGPDSGSSSRRHFAVFLVAVSLLGVVSAALASRSYLSRTELAKGIEAVAPGESHYVEIPAFVTETAGYSIPQPDAVPTVEAALVQRAAEIAARFGPSPEEVMQTARFRILDAIRAAHQGAMLAEPSILGVGIGHDRARGDWELVVLVPEGVPFRDAEGALARLGIPGQLEDFPYRLESSSPVRITAGERPGEARIWAGVIANNACQGYGTMGWLVQSNVADEVKVNGSSTGAQSIGFLTVLHGTAPGPNHPWENFTTIPREIQWQSQTLSDCTDAPKAGQVIRPGPHEFILHYELLSQDIDFVSLYEERACSQAAASPDEQEGLPSCEGLFFPLGAEFLAEAFSPESFSLIFAETQTCGGETSELRTGMVDLLQVATDVEVVDWDGNPVTDTLGNPTFVQLNDMVRVVNDLSLNPPFGVPGDSGGPVWAFDVDALDGNGAWRPLGIQATQALDGDMEYSFITPLPDNLKAFDVRLILNNPRDPNAEPCTTTCDCPCEERRLGVGPTEGRRFLDFALATAPKEMERLTLLAVRYQKELLALEQAPGADAYGGLFDAALAPLLRDAFTAPERRRELTGGEVRTALKILAWGYHSLKSTELRQEASRMYRVLAAYGAGRTVQDLLKIYLEGTERLKA